jgi:type I restriction enzyme S subunit
MNNELPGGWALATFSQIATINPRHPKGLDDLLPVSFAPMAALNPDKPSFQFLEERPLGAVRKGFTHFSDGDVLFAKITPCMENGKGAVAANLSNGLGCGTTEVHVIRPLDGIDPNYIYRFLAQPRIRQEAKNNFTSSAGQARVPLSFIEELTIPLAPAEEQKRIVAKLDTVLAKVQGCQDRLVRIPMILKRFRQSILAAAVTGKLTRDWRSANFGAVEQIRNVATEDAPFDIPESWRWLTCREVALSKNGAIGAGPFGTIFKAKDFRDSGVPIIFLRHVGAGRYLTPELCTRTADRVRPETQRTIW